MSRWIVFDQATAASVETKTSSRVELRAPSDESAGIVGMAAATPGAAVALVPATEPGHALVMRFTQNETRPTQTSPLTSGAHFAPGGFLGLADEVVLEDEPAPPRKWWQKILD